MERLGPLEDARKINPRIIYAVASGYGRMDLIATGRAGSVGSGHVRPRGREAVARMAPGRSRIVPSTIHGASLFAVVSGALHRQRATGEGCRVDVSLLAAALDLRPRA